MPGIKGLLRDNLCSLRGDICSAECDLLCGANLFTYFTSPRLSCQLPAPLTFSLSLRMVLVATEKASGL